MANPEWGTKRICQSCGARFYDMGRNPITCPKCEAVFDVDAAVKLKRGRSAPQEVKVKEKATVEEIDVETNKDAVEIAAEGTDNEDILEDTDDLDEDAEDIPVVSVAEEDERAV